MLYTEKEKTEIERVRKVFAEHLQQSTNFELLWSDKVGFVWLAIGLNPLYVDTGRRMQSGQRQRSLPSVSGWRTPNGNVPSISPRRAKSLAVMCRSMTAYEPKQEVEAGMGVLPG